MQKLAVPALLMLLPQLQGASCHFCIGLVWPIGAADHARLAARGGAGVPRTPGVEQSDLCTATQQVQGGPSAERARPNHGYMNFWLHFDFSRTVRSVEHIRRS